MQYKVPQNVDVEDRVIGPLTVRQFMIILVGGGAILVLNFVLIGPLRFMFFLLTFLIGALALGLAFGKYGDQNIEVFLLSAFSTFINPRKRVWQKEEAQPQKEEQRSVTEEASNEIKKTNISEARSNLDKLAELVDTGGYAAVSGPESTETTDIIEVAEAKNVEVDQILDQSVKATPKREKLVSEMASVPPDKRFEEEPHIILRNNK